MSQLFELPLKATPQKMTVEIAGTTYTLIVKWNTIASVWVMDIADSAGDPILTGIPLVTGADLLGQYAYLNFGGRLLAQTDHDLSQPPTFANLGKTGHVYFEVL